MAPMRSIQTAVLKLAILEPPVSAWALADQIGSIYHCAPTNGLSKRTPGATLDTDELELEVVTTLELLGATDERELGAIELDGRDDDATRMGWPEQLGRTSAPEVLPVKPKVVEAPEPRLPL